MSLEIILIFLVSQEFQSEIMRFSVQTLVFKLYLIYLRQAKSCRMEYENFCIL